MSDDFLYIDLETRSTFDLKKGGSHRYFECPTTEILLACWAIGEGPIKTWWPGDPCPPEIVAHVKAGGTVSGWNVGGFEKPAWDALLGPKHGWPVPRPEQYDDTAAAAAAMSLPRALGQAAEVLGTAAQKDDEGYRLMLRMCKPRRPRKGERKDVTLWHEEPEQMQRLALYCAEDVETERAIRKKLVPLSPDERAVWLFDLKMNERGVRIDMELVDALEKIAKQASADLDKRMATATGYEITACSQAAALTGWVSHEIGEPVTSLDKNALAALLARKDLPAHVREALDLRRQAAKTSTAKLTAMRAAACSDSRARGLHLYHGAGTGRWAGKLVQPQNMPRGSGIIKNPDKWAPALIAQPDARAVAMIHGEPMSAVSDMLRACLVASPGHRLMAADYSAIEGRVTAWLAGEADETTAYRAADAGTGPGIYEIAASGIFNVNASAVTKDQRQVGKAATLALGFGGGVLAFDAMAKIYRIDMEPVYPILRGVIDSETFERAEARYAECVERGDTGTDLMSREAWIASELTKVMWRAKHPATVALWSGLEGAARDATENPGAVSSYGRISYVNARGFLWCKLPSGRCLAYGAPRIEQRETPWGDRKPSVTAAGVDSVTRKWRRFALYGGLATENVVQAIARDLMAHGMLRAEEAGYPVVLTVHDEAVADVPDGFGSLAGFEAALCDLPAWAEGLPLVAAGYEAQRYRKD